MGICLSIRSFENDISHMKDILDSYGKPDILYTYAYPIAEPPQNGHLWKAFFERGHVTM
jgi:hypothetical protein